MTVRMNGSGLRQGALLVVMTIALGVLVLLAAPSSHATSKGSNGRLVANGRIAFVANVAGKPQIFSIDPDGTNVTQVTNRPGGAGGYGLAMSANGSRLFYVVSTKRDLLYTSAGNGVGERLLSPGCTGLCLGDNSPAVTRSGQKVVFERAFGPIVNDNAAAVAIFTMNRNGTGLMRLTQKKLPTPTEDHRADWSPDGRRVVFQRLDKSTNRSSIFVINADGTHLSRLTPASMDASNAKWSPDGRRILFNDYAEDAPGKSANLYTIRIDGTTLTKLTHYSGGTSQAFVDDWSPDGRQIVFHHLGLDAKGADVNDLYIVNADGTGAHALTHLGPEADPRIASWSAAT